MCAPLLSSYTTIQLIIIIITKANLRLLSFLFVLDSNALWKQKIIIMTAINSDLFRLRYKSLDKNHWKIITKA